MDDSRTQILPVVTEAAAPEGLTPEDTSTLPMVEAPHPSRLPRATNLLALGRVAEAAALCREELDDDPASADAYALLALAEEQSGNRHLAIELYEELLALDPTRELEAEHLETLRSEVEELDAEAQTPEEKEARLRRLQPVAVIVLAAAGVLLIMSLSLLLIVRHRNGVILQQYQTDMQYGTGWYNSGYYAQAAGYFVQALSLRPKDQNARAWYDAAVRQAQATGVPANQMPQFFAPGTNPFAPVTVNGATDQAQAVPPSLTGPGGGDTRGNSTVNPWEPSEPTPVLPQSQSTIINPPKAIPPPPPPPQQTGGTGQTGGPDAGGTPPPPPPVEAQPMIKVTRNGTRPVAGAAAKRARDYRDQGDRAYGSGDKAGALSAYQSAVSAYQAEETAHPEERQATDSAIATVNAKMRLCQ